MVTDLRKEDTTPPPRPMPNAPRALPPEQRICKDCRFYALLWLTFCCAMGGLVVPLIIIEVSEMPEASANIFALVCAIAGICAYLFFRPMQIRRADKEFADMNYHSHIHLP